MRDVSNYSGLYVPGRVPDDVRDLSRFLQSELIAIQSAIQRLADGHVDTSNIAPTKPKDGDIRLADGTNWNPGSGQGIYGYYNSSWHKLG